MLGRISSFNPKSVQPTARPLPAENGVVRSMRDNRREGLQRDRMAQQDKQNDQRRQDRAFEEMMRNPRQAGTIAQQYGIQVTPEMGQLFQDEAKTKMVLEGTQLAKNLGIERHETARVFLENYVKSNGDILSAQRSVSGMEVRNPRQGSPYENQIKLGNNVYDRNSGQVIIQGPDEGGNDTFFDDERIPPHLRARGQLIMDGNSPYPIGDIDKLYQEAQPYLNQPQAPTQTPSIAPPTAQAQEGAMIAPMAPPADEPGAKFMGFDVVNGIAKFQRPDGSSFGLKN